MENVIQGLVKVPKTHAMQAHDNYVDVHNKHVDIWDSIKKKYIEDVSKEIVRHGFLWLQKSLKGDFYTDNELLYDDVGAFGTFNTAYDKLYHLGYVQDPESMKYALLSNTLSDYVTEIQGLVREDQEFIYANSSLNKFIKEWYKRK